MPDILDDELFSQSAEPLILIKSDSPYFTVVKYNEAYQMVSRTVGIDLIGKSMHEIYKWNSDNEDSALLIHDLLNETITKKETITLPAVRYDLPAVSGGQVQASWWQAVYEPILAENGSVDYILCITRDITAQMLSKEEE